MAHITTPYHHHGGATPGFTQACGTWAFVMKLTDYKILKTNYAALDTPLLLTQSPPTATGSLFTYISLRPTPQSTRLSYALCQQKLSIRKTFGIPGDNVTTLFGRGSALTPQLRRTHTHRPVTKHSKQSTHQWHTRNRNNTYTRYTVVTINKP